jgi:hypothetical protein
MNHSKTALLDFPDEPLEDREKKLLLAVKVFIEGAFAQAGLGGDVGHIGAGVSFAAENRGGRLDDMGFFFFFSLKF